VVVVGLEVEVELAEGLVVVVGLEVEVELVEG
jgi:hypothetical protein